MKRDRRGAGPSTVFPGEPAGGQRRLHLGEPEVIIFSSLAFGSEYRTLCHRGQPSAWPHGLHPSLLQSPPFLPSHPHINRTRLTKLVNGGNPNDVVIDSPHILFFGGLCPMVPNRKRLYIVKAVYCHHSYLTYMQSTS